MGGDYNELSRFAYHVRRRAARSEQRVYIYVQQPKRYKTPEDIARKDADIARQIERMQRLIDDLRDYRVALAQRYAELETMPYTRVLTLKRDPSYKAALPTG